MFGEIDEKRKVPKLFLNTADKLIAELSHANWISTIQTIFEGGITPKENLILEKDANDFTLKEILMAYFYFFACIPAFDNAAVLFERFIDFDDLLENGERGISFIFYQ